MVKAHLIEKVTAAGLLIAVASPTWQASSQTGREVSAHRLWCLALTRHRESMAREMVRVTRPGGRVGAYVWDYAGGMQMMRHFWDAAIAVSPNDAKLDQAERFPLCQPGPLQALFEQVRLKSVTVRAIDIPTVFQDFEDYWNPFLCRTGAAPSYLASAGAEVQERIRLYLKSRHTSTRGGPIELTAQAGGFTVLCKRASCEVSILYM